MTGANNTSCTPQIERFVSAVITAGVVTARPALFVAEVQPPAISTEYCAASVTETFVSTMKELVRPAITTPFFRQTKVKGPEPEAIVAKLTVAPAQCD